MNFTGFIMGNSESKSINIEKKVESLTDHSLDENKEESLYDHSTEDENSNEDSNEDSGQYAIIKNNNKDKKDKKLSIGVKMVIGIATIGITAFCVWLGIHLSRGKTDEKPGKDSAPVNKRTSIASKSTSPQSPGAGSKKKNSNPDDSSIASDTQSTTPQVLPVDSDLIVNATDNKENQKEIKLQKQPLNKSIIIDNSNEIVKTFQNKYLEIKQLIEKLTYDTDLTEQEKTLFNKNIEILLELEKNLEKNKNSLDWIKTQKKSIDDELSDFINTFNNDYQKIFNKEIYRLNNEKVYFVNENPISKSLSLFYDLKILHKQSLLKKIDISLKELETNYNALTNSFKKISKNDSYSYQEKIIIPWKILIDKYSQEIGILLKNTIKSDKMITEIYKKIFKIQEQQKILNGKDLKFFIDKNDIQEIKNSPQNLKNETTEMDFLIFYKKITEVAKSKIIKKIKKITDIDISYINNIFSKYKISSAFFTDAMNNKQIFLNKDLKILIDTYSEICCYDYNVREDFKKRFTQKIIQGCFYTGPNNLKYQIEANEDKIKIEDNLYLLIAIDAISNYTEKDKTNDNYLNAINMNLAVYTSATFGLFNTYKVEFKGSTSTLSIKMEDETKEIVIINKEGIYKTDLTEDDIDLLKNLKEKVKEGSNKFITYIKATDPKTINMNDLKNAIVEELFNRNDTLKRDLDLRISIDKKNSQSKN
jgi:hypothetical protein